MLMKFIFGSLLSAIVLCVLRFTDSDYPLVSSNSSYFRNASCALNLRSTLLFSHMVGCDLYMYFYFNVFICLNRNKLFLHFIYCIFISKIVKMGSKLLVSRCNLSMAFVSPRTVVLFVTYIFYTILDFKML